MIVLTAIGRTVRLALLLTPPELAVMLPVWTLSAAVVMIVKVLEVLPAGMVTLAGSVTAESEASLLRLTVAPPAGAGLLIVTLPMAFLQPMTVPGFTVSAVRETVLSS